MLKIAVNSAVDPTVDPAAPVVRRSPLRRCLPWLMACGLVYLASGPAALAQDDVSAGATSASPTRLHQVWIEARDAQGRAVEDLTPQDLVVVEGDDSYLPMTLDSVEEPGRFVVWHDVQLASTRNLRQSAATMTELARSLAEAGEVEWVMFDEEPEVSVAGREILVLTEAFSRSALTEVGKNGVLDIRRRTLRRLQPAPGQPPWSAVELAEMVVAGVHEELELVTYRHQALLLWAAKPQRRTETNTGSGSDTARGELSGPSVLFWTVDGFDLDPVSFYTQYLSDEALREVLRRTTRIPTLDATVDDTAKVLAALGWSVVPVAYTPTQKELEELEFSSIQSADPDDSSVTSAPGVTIRPGEILRRRRAEEAAKTAHPEPRLVRPLQGLRRIAEATGGEVAVSDAGLRDVAQRLLQRRRLSYRSALQTAAGVTSLEVRSQRPDLSLRHRRFVSRGTPEKVAQLRLERLLAGFEERGELDVAAVLQVADDETASRGDLEARLGLNELEATADSTDRSLAGATLRVSVAVAEESGKVSFRHQLFSPNDLDQRQEWRYRTDLELPDGATEVAVSIEALERSAWGGRRASVLRGASSDTADLLPTPTVIEVERPEVSEVLKGRRKFGTRVFDAKVQRVEFLLDDRQVAEATRPPFSARLDLGRTPRRQQLTVVAYGLDGSEMGRDSVVLNAGNGGLGISIVQPASGQGSGRVDVVAEVEIPVERRLDRVVFFWNNQSVATLYGPPYRQRIDIPADKPVGYVRAVVILDDGSLAEDVLFMNGPAVASERLEVNLVELFVVVTDKDSRPVRGLQAADFAVREDGISQDVTTFSDASDLPITLGMAIDSSASMFVKLPGVQKAATDFLQSTFSEQDRAFVVDFDSEPRLARGTTGDLDRIIHAIDDLEASGRTALWESMVFSLVQLQGVTGRKALVVFSDGADEDDKFPFRSSLSVARKMGVPIYLILMKKQPKEATGLSLLVRSFTSRVDRLVGATGGRVFYAKEYGDLGEVYSEIEEELRSQYLLAFYPKEPSRGESWRTIKIDVDKKGLEARTLQGYWD